MAQIPVAHFYWDPPSVLFNIPFLNHPVRIYGALFALGFLAGYYLIGQAMKRYLLFKGDEPKRAAYLSKKLADRITWMSVIGGILGARLGHVLFYDLELILKYPYKVLSIWEGGLASHGGAVGLLIMLPLFWRWSKKDLHQISFLGWFDLFVVPVALVAVFIRLGNFFNQEILGTFSNVPWAVVFSQAVDRLPPFPRHPAQLYEAIAYLTTYLTLTWASGKPHKNGFIVGLFFLMVFGSRFFIEFLKSGEGGIFDEGLLQTGQLLSVPFILAGLYLTMRRVKREPLAHLERPL